MKAPAFRANLSDLHFSPPHFSPLVRELSAHSEKKRRIDPLNAMLPEENPFFSLSLRNMPPIKRGASLCTDTTDCADLDSLNAFVTPPTQTSSEVLSWTTHRVLSPSSELFPEALSEALWA